MAGFFKKVFSFGKKEVEERPADEPLAPINWAALEALKAERAGEPKPSPEVPPAPPEPAPAEPVPSPEIQPEPAPQTQPGPPPEQPVIPEPETPAPQPREVPPVPATPQPAPPEVPPAPQPAKPEIAPEVPERPAEVPPSPPPEEPSPQPSEIPPVPERTPAEIPPPIRQPSPIESQPMLDEIAPELDAAPTPPSPRLRGEGSEAGLPAEQGEGQHQSDQAAQQSAQSATTSAAPHPPAGPFSPQAGRREAGKVTVAKKVEHKAEAQPAPAPAAPKKSWFQRMREGLARSSRELSGNIAGVFTKRKLDDDTLQDLEDVLIRADLGVETALRVTDTLAASRYGKDVSEAEVRSVMASEVEKVLAPVALPLELDLSHKPHVILVVGVNGTGKTTTIGKLAAKLADGGLSVMLAAGDTFRAAAIEQLKIWGERTGSPVVATRLGADAAGLAYDAFQKAREAGCDVLIIDTAGRLQNKTELMAELEKIVRVLGKLDPEAPHTVLQTVDATTGQNALNQVDIFRNIAGVNGLVMTKLDGTARGGILVAIAAKHRLPVYFIGVGEQVDDLEPFSANEFARAIAGVA